MQGENREFWRFSKTAESQLIHTPLRIADHSLADVIRRSEARNRGYRRVSASDRSPRLSKSGSMTGVSQMVRA